MVVFVKVTSKVASIFSTIFSFQMRPRNLMSVVRVAEATSFPFFFSLMMMESVVFDAKYKLKSTVFPPFTQNLAKTFSVVPMLKLFEF